MGAKQQKQDALLDVAVWPPDQVRSSGMYWVAYKGAGKSRALGRFIVRQDVIRGIGGLVIDPMGGLIDNLLDSVLRLPQEARRQIWDRLVYIDMGNREAVVPFPLYYRLDEHDSLYRVSTRFVDVVRMLDPNLQTAAIEGWNSFSPCATNVGMAIAALGGQVLDASGLLLYPDNYKKALESAVKREPDVAEAIKYLYTELASLKADVRARRTAIFLQKIAVFSKESSMRAMFGADQPGINWQQVVEEGKTVLVDLRNVQDFEFRRFLFLWTLMHFLEFVKKRGTGRHKPVSLVIDELSQLSSLDKQTEKELFGELINELLNVYARQCQVWPTLCQQEIWQSSENLQKTLMGCGVRVVGRTSDVFAAILLARQLLPVNLNKVKRREPVFGREGEILYERPVTYTIEEQQYLQSLLFSGLGRFKFLVKSISGEGDSDLPLRPLDLNQIEPGCFPNDQQLIRVRSLLHQRTATPVVDILAAIKHRQRVWLTEVNRNAGSDIVRAITDDDGYRQDE